VGSCTVLIEILFRIFELFCTSSWNE